MCGRMGYASGEQDEIGNAQMEAQPRPFALEAAKGLILVQQICQMRLCNRVLCRLGYLK